MGTGSSRAQTAVKDATAKCKLLCTSKARCIEIYMEFAVTVEEQAWIRSTYRVRHVSRAVHFVLFTIVPLTAAARNDELLLFFCCILCGAASTGRYRLAVTEGVFHHSKSNCFHTAFFSQDLCSRGPDGSAVDKATFLRVFPLPGLLGGEDFLSFRPIL